MSQYSAPNPGEREIIRANGIDPDSVAVQLHGDGFLLLLCYRTRCTIRIDKGDAPWAF